MTSDYLSKLWPGAIFYVLTFFFKQTTEFTKAASKLQVLKKSLKLAMTGK